MIDVKKFVVAFLVLAALAGSSALVLLNVHGDATAVSSLQNSTGPAGQVSASSGGQAGGPFALGNAFVPSAGVNYDPAGNFSDASSSASSSDPNNLTSQLANSMLSNLFAVNPDGPQTTSNGQQIIAEPNAQSVVDGLSTSTLAGVEIPNWDYEAAKITLNISPNTSTGTVTAYYNSLNDTWQKDFMANGLQNALSDPTNAGPDELTLAESSIQDAIMQIGGLSVPSNLSDFQKKLVTMLVYEKNTLALAGNAPTDPMRTTLVFQAEQNKYNAALQSFEDAMQAAYQVPPPAAQHDALSFLNSLIGIQEAHAQFGGVVFDPSVFGQIVWQFAQTTLLQILKNTLITQLQNRALSFIQNAGSPRYVTGWSSLLSNSFNTAAGFALGQIEPGFCADFNPEVSGWLQNLYPGATPVAGGISLNGAGSTNCSIQSSIGSTVNFFNDFNTGGGWVGFGALLVPQNNPYGAFALANDEILALGNSAQTASQNKAVAGQGYQGISICDDGSDAGKPQQVCSQGVLVGGQCLAPNSSQVIGTPVSIPGSCKDGSEPVTTFPGANAADTLSQNLNSDIQLIVNSGNIAGLLTTVTTALLQQVVTNGVNALNGAIAGAGSSATPKPPAIPVGCSPLQATATVGTPFTFGATGGDGLNFTWSAPGGSPGTGTGPAFTTTFALPGTYSVTASGPVNGVIQTSSCKVTAS